MAEIGDYEGMLSAINGYPTYVRRRAIDIDLMKDSYLSGLMKKGAV